MADVSAGQATLLLSIVVTVVLAMVTGFSVLAFKRPRIYRKLFTPLAAGVLLAGITASIYGFATTITYSKLIPFMVPDKTEAAAKAISGYPFGGFVPLAGCAGALFVLYVLKLLAELVEEDDKEDKPKDPRAKRDAD